MNIFLIYVRDEDYYQMLPRELGGSRPDDQRVKIMAFPPLGIETLAPVVRQHGHCVRMFDTCHPQMKAEHIAEAVKDERPDVIAISFLSTTTYPPDQGPGGEAQGSRTAHADHPGRCFCLHECRSDFRGLSRGGLHWGW